MTLRIYWFRLILTEHKFQALSLEIPEVSLPALLTADHHGTVPSAKNIEPGHGVFNSARLVGQIIHMYEKSDAILTRSPPLPAQ